MTLNPVENYRGFVISWIEPPLTSATWTSNVATESVRLLNLMGGKGCEVIDGRSRNEMLAKAHEYVDALLARTRPSVPDAATCTIRDIFLEALAKKAHDAPWPEIRAHLIGRAHDIGHAAFDESRLGNKYELSFRTGEKISFDGVDYRYTRS